MSDEQLEFFSDQTRRAVHKAVGKYVRGAVVGFLVLLVGIGFALHDANSARHAVVQSARAVAVSSCNGRYQDREGLRNLLISAERQIPREVKRGNMTPEQAASAKVFYFSQLHKLKLPDCRAAARIITDDPDSTTRIPVALHPPEQTLLPSASFHDAIFTG